MVKFSRVLVCACLSLFFLFSGCSYGPGEAKPSGNAIHMMPELLNKEDFQKALAKGSPYAEATSWAYLWYTAGLGKGSGVVESASPVKVGETVSQVKLTFTADKDGIKPGGRVLLWFPNGGTRPQLEDPNKEGHLTISSVKALESTVEYQWFWAGYAQFLNDDFLRIVNTLLPDGLAAGETITYVWKSPTTPTQSCRWEGGQWRFRFYVDNDADSYSEEIPDALWVSIVPDTADRLTLRAESTVVVGEEVRVVAALLDKYDNPAISYRGLVGFSCDGEGATLPTRYRFMEMDKGSHTFSCSFSEPGFYWVKIFDSENNLIGESNPIEVFEKEPEYRLYWGDLHVHTEMSADAIGSAATFSTYEGAYSIGRYRSGLDFMANADHHGFPQGNYTPAQWESMKEITNNANAEGEFVTLLAVEMSHGQGDQNVYFRGDDMPYLFHGPDHPLDLWEILHNYECISVPHHFAQSMRPWDWNNYDADLMTVAEIFSEHGRAEYFNNEPSYSYHKIATLEGQTWQDQLKKGRKMGCIGSSDNHWAKGGFTGLAAVWSKSLTREGIYDNIKARHCYASTNARAIIHFTVNGVEMGNEITSSKPPVIKVRTACPTEILRITVVKNGEDVFVKDSLASRTAEFTWNDTELSGEAYYYLRVEMKGDKDCGSLATKENPQFVWSSPVWVTKK